MSIDRINVSENAEPNPESKTSELHSNSTHINPSAESKKTQVPKPGAHIAKAFVSQQSVPVSHQRSHDASVFGYIDEQGQVWRKSSQGDIVIAQWHAGDEKSGLEHFRLKYQEILDEISILKTRLRNGADAQSIYFSAQKISASIENAPILGDMNLLNATMAELIAQSCQEAELQVKDKELRLAAALERKTAIIAEAEALINSEEWKATGQKLNELTQEWENLPKLPRKDESVLWKKFIKAKDVFHKRRGSYFSALDKRKLTAKTLKENLVHKAQDIVAPFIKKDSSKSAIEHHSLAWLQASHELRELLNEWKKIGRTDKTQDDELWQKFKATNDAFFAERKQILASEQEEKEATAKHIKEKIDSYKSKISDADLPEARMIFQKLVKEISELPGAVPDKKHKVFSEVKSLESSLKNRQVAAWESNNSESKARAEQFQQKADKLKSQADKAFKSGNEKLGTKLNNDAQQWEEWARAALNSVKED